LLAQFINRAAFAPIKDWLRGRDTALRLFRNDKTPARGDTAADYGEANFSGYSPELLPAWRWSESADGLELSQPEQTFRSALDQTTQNIFGWYLTAEGSGDLVAAGRFGDAPNPISNLNDRIKITPYFMAEKPESGKPNV
jgi:hypothetical protein